jgi:hypothetical protein
MAHRTSERDRTREVHHGDSSLNKRQQLEDDGRNSRFPGVLEADHDRNDDEPQFVVLFFHS